MDDSVDLTYFREQYSYYARRLLGDLGLSDLEEPQRGQLLASIEEYVSQVLTNTILESLDDAAIQGINDHLEKGRTNEQVMLYLVSSIPDIEDKIATALSQAYAKMLVETQEMTKAFTDMAKDSEAGAMPQHSAPQHSAPNEEPLAASAPTSTPPPTTGWDSPQA